MIRVRHRRKVKLSMLINPPRYRWKYGNSIKLMGEDRKLLSYLSIFEHADDSARRFTAFRLLDYSINYSTTLIIRLSLDRHRKPSSR